MQRVAWLAAVVLILGAACSSRPSSREQPVPSSDVPASRIEQLISADTVGVLRQPPEQFFVLRYTDELIAGLAGGSGVPACWAALGKRVKTGYQLLLAGRSSYFAVEIEGPAPSPADVIECVKSATHGDIVGRADGELYAFASPGGTAHASWRGSYIVVGNREQVQAALKTPTAESAARWLRLLAPFAASHTAGVWTDHMFDDIVGENTTSYAFTIDKLESSPRVFVAGRLVVQYATPAAAEAGEHWIRDWSARGQFPRRIDDAAIMQYFDRIAAGVQKTRITRTGTTLELAFDSDQFGGAEALLSALQQLGEAK